jgi:hypothetical protein
MTELAERPESALQTSQGLMPALSFNQMAVRYNAMQQMAKEIMRRDADYGVIPGTGDKPTLLKPGAEKLCALFGLRPMFVVVREVEDWEKGVFYYWYKCQLYSGDRLVGEGEGSANSKEKKYRWRTVYDNKATPEEKRVGRLEERKGRNNSTYKVYVVENTEPFDLINTLQKMAQKRALVAATLIVTSASDFFTQDVEDMVDVEVREVPAAEPAAEPEPRQPPRNDAGELLVTPSQVTALSIALKQAGFGTDAKGKADGRVFLGWLADVDELATVKDLTKEQAQRALDRLGTGENGSYRTDKAKVDQAFQDYAEHQAGQQFEREQTGAEAA